jgi:hypothetical protein
VCEATSAYVQTRCGQLGPLPPIMDIPWEQMQNPRSQSRHHGKVCMESGFFFAPHPG